MYTNVLMLEYGNIANIVRQSPAMRTPQMSSNLMKLVLDSLDHAEFVIHLLKDAGVEPSVVWTFPGKTMLAKSYGVNWKPSVLWPGLIGR